MRWAALAVMALVLLLEGRFRWEDWRARPGFRYVPVTLRPGSMEVDEPKHRELVAVNGRPVNGTSGFWGELRRYEERSMDPERFVPFVVSLRKADGQVEDVEAHFAHCTCGRPSKALTVWYAMAPPMVMILTGLAAVLLWPGRGMAWALLALALGAAQMTLVPDGIWRFRSTAEPLDWGAAMRLPWLVYHSFFMVSWPGWALRLVGTRWLGVMPWLVLGVMGVVKEVGWAENARATAWLWEWHAQWSSELLVGAMLISVVCLPGWRRWAGLGVWGLAVWLITWPVGPGLTIRLVTYSDDSQKFVAQIPEIYWTPEVLLAGGLAGVCFLGRRGWAVVLLCVPMLAVAVIETRWLPWEEYVLNAVVVAGYLGLAASVAGLRAADAR